MKNLTILFVSAVLLIVYSCSNSETKTETKETKITIENKVDEEDPAMEEYKSIVDEAYLLKVDGEVEKALEKFDQAIELMPEKAEAYNEKAILYLETSDFVKAEEILLQSVEVEKTALGLMNLSYLKYMRSELDEALELNNAALDLEPENEQALVNSISIKANMNDLEGALEAAEKLIELDNTNGMYVHNKAYVLHLMGKTDEACEIFKEAVELGSEPSKQAMELYCK